MPGPRGVPDFGEASGPRVYDFLLGGKDNFAPDRKLAEELEDPVTGCPGLRSLARENRAFILKAVAWTARMKGIGQFLDLGCGLPAAPAVHEAVDGQAAVCYVDCDPLVVSHCRAGYGGMDGVAVVEADVSDPEAVLADAGLAGVIDLSQPACAVFGAVLSAMDAGVARKTVAGFAEALAPGSAVVISCASFAAASLGERMAGAFSPALPGGWRNHSAADVESFFAAAGLRLIHQRVMDVSCWPACSARVSGVPDAAVLGGIGIKDER